MMKHVLCMILFCSAGMVFAQVPVVKFGASKRVVEQYESVQMFDSSTNAPYQWEWNIYDSTTYKSSGFYPSLNGGEVYSDPWGNGNNEFAKNAEFAFDYPGTYTVTLRSRNSSGWSTVLVKKGYIKCSLPTQYNLGYGTYGPNNDNVVEGEEGTIFDDGGPNMKYGINQGVNTRSYLLIRPCHAKKIILTMSKLIFADANDILYVYDAETADNSKLLAAWTKNNTSGKTVTALSGSMYILFKSDGSGVDSGFAGTYVTELDTSTVSASLSLIKEPAVYNSTPTKFSYTSQNIYGTPTFNWTIDNNQVSNNTKKDFKYTFYTDGKYKICINVNHCQGYVTACDTIDVVTADTITKLNFKASSLYTDAIGSVVLTPLTDNANRFQWTITPKSYVLLNPPASPSTYDTSAIRYNFTPGDSLPRPRIRFLDTVCYTIKLVAFNSLDPASTSDTLVKYDYVCGKDISDVYGQLYGKVYHDLNSDCQLSGAEKGVKDIKVMLYDSSNNLAGITYSGQDGIFGFGYNTYGKYKMQMNIANKPFKSHCPPGLDSIITFSKQNPFNGLDFAFECDSKVDLGVQSVYTTNIVFPGRNHTLNVDAGFMNQWKGLICANPSKSGSVKISVTGNVTYKGVSGTALTPSSISGKVFTYNISDFSTIGSGDFRLVFRTDTFAQAGDTVSVFVEVLPTSGDNDTVNNRWKSIYLVRNSYDPNLKEVSPLDVPPGYNDWLTYTIHFQNTGSAPAFNIRLEDTLSSLLDLETFQVLNYSHPNRVLVNNKLLKIYFDDIMLPDSFSDKPGSMGFFQYRIKPAANLPKGTAIRNTAYIYFDYNKAVVTNTTLNEYVEEESSIRHIQGPQLKLYPNPGTGLYKIGNPSGALMKMEVYDALGVLVYSGSGDQEVNQLDLSYLADGMYIIKVYVNNQVSVAKVLKCREQ